MKDKRILPQLQLVESVAVPKNTIVAIPDLTQRVPPVLADTDLNEYLRTCVLVTNVWGEDDDINN